MRNDLSTRKIFDTILCMRTFALVVFILPFFACAREVTVGQLPSPLYLDTEVSTNIAFQVEVGNFNRLEFTLGVEASASNSVEAAIGTDANSDGVLSLDEVDVAFGCDCGKWFERFSRQNGSEKSLETVNGATCRKFVVRRKDIDVNWNLISVKRRGIGVSNERVTVNETTRGIHLIVN